MPAYKRCLPSFAMRTAGLLVMLCRWGFLARESGGLLPKPARDNATAVFRGLASMCDKGEDDVWRVPIDLAKRWVCEWPRPPRADVIFIELEVLHGEVDMAPLRELAEGRNRHSVAWLWWGQLSKVFDFGQTSVVSLENLFSRACGDATLRPLVSQMLWAVAVRVEKELGALLTKKRAAAKSDMVTCKWVSVQEVLGDGYRGKQYLVKYVAACKRAAQGHFVVSLAADKATLAGLPLVNVVLALPNGKAMCMPPQVVLVGGGANRSAEYFPGAGA